MPRACARALGVRYDILPIAPVVEGFETVLAPLFEGLAPGTTEENIQSRARGTLLMAVSNKFGPMLVTTGNKSEMSVGYATIYGDMNGGFNPIKDLYKMEVFRLAELRNRWKPQRRARAFDGEVITGQHSDQAALGRIAREPDGSGFAAALRGARRDPRRARRKGNARRRSRRRRAMISRP